MAFMTKRNQGKTVVIIMAIVVSIALIAGIIASYFSTAGNYNTNTNNESNLEDYYKQVIKTYQDQIKNNPNDISLAENLASKGYFELGLVYYNKETQTKDLKKADEYKKNAEEQFNLAITELEKVVRANPKNAPSLGDLATAYFYTNRPDDAIATAKKALDADPNLIAARLNLARYYGYGKGDYKSAIDELKKVSDSDPNYQVAKSMIDEFTNAASAPAANSQTKYQLPSNK